MIWLDAYDWYLSFRYGKNLHLVEAITNLNPVTFFFFTFPSERAKLSEDTSSVFLEFEQTLTRVDRPVVNINLIIIHFSHLTPSEVHVSEWYR